MPDRPPQFSVITVCRNAVATIAATLDSVSAQRGVRVEHIVIDGASDDGTADIVRRHRPAVARLLSEPDAGMYTALNKGLALASGDIVGCLNADDVFADAKALATYAAAFEDPHVDICYADLDMIAPTPPHQVVRRWRVGDYHQRALLRGWAPPHPTFYVRRSLAARVGPYDEQLVIASDIDWMCRALLTPGSQARYLPRVQVHMRTGGLSNATWRQTLLHSRERAQVLRRHGASRFPWWVFTRTASRLAQHWGGG